jgi:serine/threonine-protein kinase
MTGFSRETGGSGYHVAVSLTAGDVFAGYTIIRQLGAGGMGVVYLAQHPRLPRTDAIKVLPASLTTDPQFRARFVREADLAAGLWHPHIVGVHDRGEFDDQLWISMDYVEGTDAQRMIEQRGPHGVPVGEVVDMITAVADALDYAHQRGLLHRDVKPGNILLAEAGGKRRITLADFGIARQMDEVSALTATNMTIGSIPYAAPEQLSGEGMDGRADQYALACTAFHLLTGSPPFAYSNPAVVIGQHLTAPPPPVSALRPDLASLDRVFATGLAKRPQDRFPTCGGFAEALARETGVSASQATTTPVIPSYPPPPLLSTPVPPAPVPAAATPRPRWLLPAGIAVVLVAVIGVVAGVALSGESDSPPVADTPTSAVAAPAPTASPPSSPAAKPSPSGATPFTVLLDGQPQNVTGDVTCVTYQGETYLTIQGSSTISVGMRVGDPPAVTLIGMVDVGGFTLGYNEGGAGSAEAVKNGSTYTVTGTITGAESVDPTGPVTKDVAITVVCP